MFYYLLVVFLNNFSCFGKAFEQAAASTNSRMIQDNFDQHSKFVSVTL